MSAAFCCTLPASLKSEWEKPWSARRGGVMRGQPVAVEMAGSHGAAATWSALMSVFMSIVSSSARSGPLISTASSTMSVFSTTRGRWLERRTVCHTADRMMR